MIITFIFLFPPLHVLLEEPLLAASDLALVLFPSHPLTFWSTPSCTPTASVVLPSPSSQPPSTCDPRGPFYPKSLSSPGVEGCFAK